MHVPINIIVTEAEAQEPIPEGVYKAIVKEIEEGEGEFGEYIKFTFEITDESQKGVTRSSVASKKLSLLKSGKTSKLYEYVKALTKSEPETGEEFDVETLKGLPCQIFVKNGKEKDGILYQNIDAVMPA